MLPVTFPARRVLLLIAAVAAALFALPASPAAALTTPMAFLNTSPVTANAIVAVTGGQFAAGDIDDGQASPDGQHVAFVVTTGTSMNYASAVWVMHADGSQLTPLASTQGDWGYYVTPKWSADSTAVEYTHFSDYDSVITLDEYQHLTSASPDVWADGPGFDIFPHTNDGQWRIISADGINDEVYYLAQSLSTGDEFPILTVGGPTSWTPGSGCDTTGLAPSASNIDAALSGSFAACSFTGVDQSPAYGVPAGSYTPVSTSPVEGNLAFLATDGVPTYAISDAHYSPDRTRILFKKSLRSAPDSNGNTTLVSQAYVVARADGSQQHTFDVASEAQNDLVGGGAWTANGNAITYRVFGVQDPGSGRAVYAKLTVASDTDTWSTVPNDEVGTTTADGRFRIVQPADLGVAGTYRAIDLATGTGYDVLTYSGNGTGATFKWAAGSGCDSTGLSAAPSSIGAALAGPHPACTFAQAVVQKTDSSTTPAVTRPIATSTPAATPIATPAPAFRVLVLATTKLLSKVKTSGLGVKFTAPGATKVQVWLLGPSGKTLARGSVPKPASGAIVLKLTGAGRKAVKGHKSIKATVRISATDATGRLTTVNTPLTLAH